jgi:hypothetical protein
LRFKPDDFAEAAPDAITFHGISDLFRNGEAHARRSVLLTITHLEHKGLSRHLGRGRSGQEIRSLPQSFHENNARRSAPESMR